MCAECCPQVQGSSKAENRGPAHEEFIAKDPHKVQKHSLGVVFQLTWVGFGSAQSLSRARLFATPWGGQALHEMTVWSPSEPQPTAFRDISSLRGRLLPQQAHNPSALRVPGSRGDSAVPEKTRGAGAPGARAPSAAGRQRLGARGHLGQGPSKADRASSMQGRAARDRGQACSTGSPWSQWTSAPRAQPRECRRAHVSTHPGRGLLIQGHEHSGTPTLQTPHLQDCPPPVNDTPSWELRGTTGVTWGLCVKLGVPVGVQGGRGDGGPQRLFLPPCCAPRSLSLEKEALRPAPSEIACGGRGPHRSGPRLVLPEPWVPGKTTHSLWPPVPVTADAEGQEPAETTLSSPSLGPLFQTLPSPGPPPASPF